MKYLQIKANKIIKLVIEWELSRSLLKFVASNLFLSYETRQFAILSLSNLSLQSSVVHLKLRCVVSNQSRSILTFFKLNRMQFKIAASKGNLNGLKKNMF